MTEIHCNKFCVYSHSIEGEIFYVGKGRGYRAYESARRNKVWTSYVNGKSFFVEILQWFETENEAKLFESQEIQRLKPIANIMQNGFAQSDTQKRRASETHKGKIVPLETRNKISKKMKGKTPWNKGRSMSEAERELCRQKSVGAIKIKDIETGEVYGSVKEACRTLDIPKTTLLQHLRGKLTHARGMKFERIIL